MCPGICLHASFLSDVLDVVCSLTSVCLANLKWKTHAIKIKRKKLPFFLLKFCEDESKKKWKGHGSNTFIWMNFSKDNIVWFFTSLYAAFRFFPLFSAQLALIRYNVSNTEFRLRNCLMMASHKERHMQEASTESKKRLTEKEIEREWGEEGARADIAFSDKHSKAISFRVNKWKF